MLIGQKRGKRKGREERNFVRFVLGSEEVLDIGLKKFFGFSLGKELGKISDGQFKHWLLFSGDLKPSKGVNEKTRIRRSFEDDEALQENGQALVARAQKPLFGFLVASKREER